MFLISNKFPTNFTALLWKEDPIRAPPKWLFNLWSVTCKMTIATHGTGSPGWRRIPRGSSRRAESSYVSHAPRNYPDLNPKRAPCNFHAFLGRYIKRLPGLNAGDGMLRTFSPGKISIYPLRLKKHASCPGSSEKKLETNPAYVALAIQPTVQSGGDRKGTCLPRLSFIQWARRDRALLFPWRKSMSNLGDLSRELLTLSGWYFVWFLSLIFW